MFYLLIYKFSFPKTSIFSTIPMNSAIYLQSNQSASASDNGSTNEVHSARDWKALSQELNAFYSLIHRQPLQNTFWRGYEERGRHSNILKHSVQELYACLNRKGLSRDYLSPLKNRFLNAWRTNSGTKRGKWAVKRCFSSVSERFYGNFITFVFGLRQLYPTHTKKTRSGMPSCK